MNNSFTDVNTDLIENMIENILNKNKEPSIAKKKIEELLESWVLKQVDIKNVNKEELDTVIKLADLIKIV